MSTNMWAREETSSSLQAYMALSKEWHDIQDRLTILTEERAENLTLHLSHAWSELSGDEQFMAAQYDAYLTGYREGRRGIPMLGAAP